MTTLASSNGQFANNWSAFRHHGLFFPAHDETKPHRATALPPLLHREPPRLGARVLAQGVHFAVTSEFAKKVSLVLFDNKDKQQADLCMSRNAAGEWETFVPDIGAGQHYAFRVNNASRVTLDPYALAISRQMRSYDIDNQLVTAVVVDNVSSAFSKIQTAPFNIAESRIVECDVRSRFTMGHPDIPVEERGTFKALRHPAIIAWLTRLGTNALELLPVNACKSAEYLVKRGDINAWGYGTLAGFAPDPFLCCEKDPAKQWKEVHQSFATLARAGISVILDLSLAHTAGGDFETLDRRYHRRTPEGYHINDTGCGNTFNTGFSPARQYVLDVLRLWRSYGAAGFRFDLAPVLADHDGNGSFNPAKSVYNDIGSDPLLRDALLYAEPWTCSSQHRGQFPADMAEWNDLYRDSNRRFWKGEKEITGEFATRLFGSKDIYPCPDKTLNLSAVHDGQPVRDNCTYEHKNNLENGEDNRDGNDKSYSWNCGIEGETENVAVNALRIRRARSMHATDVLASGGFIMQATDIKLHTHGGNNNAYCGDKEKFYVPWEIKKSVYAPTRSEDPYRQHEEFLRRIIQLRRHEPLMNAPRYVRWLHSSGNEMNNSNWMDKDNRLLAVTFEMLGERKKQTQVPAIYVSFNGAIEDAEITLPRSPQENYRWKRIFDTGLDQPFGPHLILNPNDKYKVLGTTVALFKAVPKRASAT